MDPSILYRYSNLPIDELTAQIAAQRGREIVIAESDFSGLQQTLCGLWLGLPSRDLIFISDDLSGLHRDHVILHELAHLLLDHQVVDAVSIEEMASLFPSLPAALVKRMLQRSHYDTEQEREAEELASAIAGKTRGTHRSTWVDQADARRAADAFGRTP